ncbi:hypothetical protein [Paraburkholderia sp. HP33-1]|nr:hypothetical protein [Paraburkholderia sp. HP33-1]
MPTSSHTTSPLIETLLPERVLAFNLLGDGLCDALDPKLDRP